MLKIQPLNKNNFKKPLGFYKQSLKKPFGFYSSQDPLIFWPISLAFLITVILVVLILLSIPKLPTQLPLYYSLPWGENQLVSLSEFLLLPVLIVLVTLINLIITWHLHTSQFVLKRVLSLASFVVAFLILITAVQIIYIFV